METSISPINKSCRNAIPMQWPLLGGIVSHQKMYVGLYEGVKILYKCWYDLMFMRRTMKKKMKHVKSSKRRAIVFRCYIPAGCVWPVLGKYVYDMFHDRKSRMHGLLCSTQSTAESEDSLLSTEDSKWTKIKYRPITWHIYKPHRTLYKN